MKSEPEKQGESSTGAAATAKDVVFECPQCGISMVVDRAAAGMTLECARCHSQVTVPAAGSCDEAESAAVQELIKENLQLRTQLQALEKQQQEIRARLNALPQRVTPIPAASAATSGEAHELRSEIAAMRSMLTGIVDRQRDEYLNLVRTGLDEARESRRQNDEMLRLIIEMAGRNGRSVHADEPAKDSNGRDDRKKALPIAAEIERLKGELRDARADLFRLATGSGLQPAPGQASAPQVAAAVGAPAEAGALTAPELSQAAAVEHLEDRNGTAIAEAAVSATPIKSRRVRRRRLRAYIGMLLPCLIFVGVLGVVWRVFVNKTQALATATPVNVVAQSKATADSDVSQPSGQEKPADTPENRQINDALRLVQSGKLVEGITAIRGILEQAPSSIDARYWLAALLAEQGHHKEAIAEYRQVLTQSPDNISTLNNLAYLLATDPDESLRNGKEAVELASRAWNLSAHRDPSILDTLAAAYAESGQFPQAVTAAKNAVAMAVANRNSEVADQIRSRLQWYEMGIPYRDNTQRAIRKPVQPEAQG
jgi:tetratricopeptide (TPR) repeat protein/predicted RNA-binding Zn-ribbon protein involved in translation (DUF1610 family)